MCAQRTQRHQPNAADDDGQYRRAGQQHSMGVMVPSRMNRRVRNNGGEDRHGGHRSGAERPDISDGRGACRQRERGNHAQEVRAARDAVQYAKTKRRVRMTHPLDPARSGLHVQVIVLHGSVNVRGRPQACTAPQRPHADDDQSRSNESLAPS